MLRILLFLAALIALNAFAEHALRRNLALLEQACAEGLCESSAGCARQAEPIIQGVHSAERMISGALVMLTVCLYSLRMRLFREIIVLVWCLGLVAVVCASGFAVAIEVIADGTELQWGFRPAAFNSIVVAAALDGLAMIGGIAALWAGPPRGWSGDDEVSLL